jgi:hypothetical protein
MLRQRMIGALGQQRDRVLIVNGEVQSASRPEDPPQL